MFRSEILVILGTSITAFVSFLVVVSYGLFPRGEYTTRLRRRSLALLPSEA